MGEKKLLLSVNFQNYVGTNSKSSQLSYKIGSKSDLFGITLYSIDTHFDATTTLKTYQNIAGNEKIAHNEQFLLFPQCFLLSQVIVSPFVHIFDIISLFAAEMKEPKIGISGKGLMYHRDSSSPISPEHDYAG